MVARLRPATLTTVIGPGGVGKTRLAVEAAMCAVPGWPDGVWFVDLASVVSADDVPSAVALAVGASIAPREDVWREVLTHLENRVLSSSWTTASTSPRGSPRSSVTCWCTAPGSACWRRVARRSDWSKSMSTDSARSPSRPSTTPASSSSSSARRAMPTGSAATTRGIVSRARRPATCNRARRGPNHRHQPRRDPRQAAQLGARPGSRDPGRPERQRSLGRSLDWSYGLLDRPARRVYRRLSVFASASISPRPSRSAPATAMVATSPPPRSRSSRGRWWTPRWWSPTPPRAQRGTAC